MYVRNNSKRYATEGTDAARSAHSSYFMALASLAALGRPREAGG